MAHRVIVKATPATRKSRVTEPACRLFGLVARKARKVVVFRRGPTMQCCLILWDLATDTFEIGQWVKTRVREQWSDVSPDAQYLAYLADGFHDGDKQGFYPYTAISRPPYFTAFAFWRTNMVGRWVSSRTYVVPEEVPKSEYNWLPSRIEVRTERGSEREFIYRAPRRYRLLRDGWTYRGSANPRAQFDLERKEAFDQRFDPPITLSKTSIHGIALEDRLLARGPRASGGPNEKIELALLKPDGTSAFTFTDADWADFDNDGDLLFARNGGLFRLSADRITGQTDAASALDASKRLIDLSPLRFEAKRAPYAGAAGP